VKPIPALLLGFALLQPVVDLDLAVQQAVQARRNPTLDRVMQAASNLGHRDVLYGSLLALAVLDPVGPGTARLAVAALIATNLVAEGLKRVINRPRPDGEQKRSDASFPSGHAASAWSLAWILTRRWRRLAVFWWALAVTVAWSRVYLNRHYLSDVVAGAGIGLLCTWGLLRLQARMAARAAVRASPPAPPP
jgi:undecaprenyl-diphosphatase